MKAVSGKRLAKWLLKRVKKSPKSQRFILGQRLSNHAMDVLELLVKTTRPIIGLPQP